MVCRQENVKTDGRRRGKPKRRNESTLVLVRLLSSCCNKPSMFVMSHHLNDFAWSRRRVWVQKYTLSHSKCYRKSGHSSTASKINL